MYLKTHSIQKATVDPQPHAGAPGTTGLLGVSRAVFLKMAPLWSSQDLSLSFAPLTQTL